MNGPRVSEPIIIAGCSRRKAACTTPVPALDLYQGGCIPALRARADGDPALRARIWIISAEHGLIHADEPLLPYDRRMDSARAAELRPQVDSRLRAECLRGGTPRCALVIAEPAYQLALAGLPAIFGDDRVTWISDPSAGWPRAEAVLADWRQPRMTGEQTLRQALTARPNAYDPAVREFERRTGLRWHDPTPPGTAAADLSVVIPARDMSYSLPAVLDALAAQQTAGRAEVIVVDDGSRDGTADLARRHPLAPRVAAIPRRLGAAAVRNVGVALASAATVVFADADMILPPHALADLAARARDDLVLLGFRHNVPWQPAGSGRPPVPGWPADLNADHRVRWRAPAGQRLIYTGITLTAPADTSPLSDTNDLRDLGHGRTYLDWDLPRMVVTALLAVPRQAFRDVGGFDPRFGRIGWGSEDTHLGAALIARGLAVAPLRQLVGYHVNPPDEAGSWQAKLATWPRTVEYYRSLLGQPPPHGRAGRFDRETAQILLGCEVTP